MVVATTGRHRHDDTDQLGGGSGIIREKGFGITMTDLQQEEGGIGGNVAFDSFDKIKVVDFDSIDLAAMDEAIMEGNQDELDKLLAEAALHGDDGGSGDGTMDDLNVAEQLNLDLNETLSLDGDGDGGSVSSMEKLLRMNLIEVDDNDKNQQRRLGTDSHNSDLMKEFAKGFLAQEGEETNASTWQQQQYSVGNDPLLGRMSGTRDNEMYEQQRRHQMQMQQQRIMEQQQEEYALHQQIEQQKQLMQIQAMMQRTTFVEEEEEEGLTASKVSQLASMGSEDLEREKMKLLQQLQVINSRQANPVVGVMQQQVPPQPRSQPFGFAASGGASSDVASVISISGNSGGETPLSAFLRSKNKGNGSAGPSQAASILSQNVPDAPAAGSFLDAVPMDIGSSSNPFLRQAAGGGNPLVGAMNKSSTSQNMIRQSLSGARVNRRSGQNLMDMLSTDLGGGSNRNAAWGSGTSSRHRAGVSSFSSSGMVPRHASDGHLLMGPATVSASLAKTKNRVGSLSRENLLYSMLKNKQGSHKTLNAMGRQSSHTRLAKSGPTAARNDSFGSLLPTKRGGGRAGHKYKVGASTSVPHLMVRGSPTPSNKHEGNAMW